MTDIVEQLREHVRNRTGSHKDMGEAADEIERLRGECRTMRSYASHRALCRAPYGMGACNCGYDDLFSPWTSPRRGE